MNIQYIASDGTKCGSVDKLRRITRRIAGMGNTPTGYPTKKQTKCRVRHYDRARAVRKARARLNYENMLFTLYPNALGDDLFAGL